MRLDATQRQALERHQIEALAERIRAGGSAADHVNLAFLLIQRQATDTQPAGWSSVRSTIERALRAYPEEPDLRFCEAFCLLQDGRKMEFGASLRRLARKDAVGASVLEALADNDNNILRRCLDGCLARSDSTDGEVAERGLADLARLHWLNPHNTRVATAYGLVLVERGDRARIREVAAALANRAGESAADHVNAGELFAYAGDRRHAVRELCVSLTHAGDPAGRQVIRHLLDQIDSTPDVAVEPVDTPSDVLLSRLPFARVTEFEWRLQFTETRTLRELDPVLAGHAELLATRSRPAEGELVRQVRDLIAEYRHSAIRQAEDLSAGVIELSSFGADLEEQFEELLAAEDREAASAVIRAHPALLTPVVVDAAASSVGRSPLEIDTGAPLVNLLTDAEEVGLARANPIIDFGVRQLDRPPEDVITLPNPDAELDAAIEELRSAVSDPAFADLARPARTKVTRELGRRLILRMRATGDLNDLVDAVVLLRRVHAVSQDPDDLYRLGAAELQLHTITDSDIALERARFLIARAIQSFKPDDPILVWCLIGRANIGIFRYQRYGWRGDLELALVFAEHLVDWPSEDGSDSVEAAASRLVLRQQIEQLLAEHDEADRLGGPAAAAVSRERSIPEPDLLVVDTMLLLDETSSMLRRAADMGVADAIEGVRDRIHRLRTHLAPHGVVAALCDLVDAEAICCQHRLSPIDDEIRDAAARLAASPERPELVRPATTLALALLYAELGATDEDAWRRATALFAELRTPANTAPPPLDWRRAGAGRWGDAAWRSGRWADAAVAYRAGLDLDQDALRSYVLHTDQLASLYNTPLAVARATWAWLRAGDPWEAVLACELGRALLLTRAMAGNHAPEPDEAGEDGADLRSAIQDASRAAPLVYLVAGDDSGVALIVEGDRLSVVELPGLSDAAARAAAEELLGNRSSQRLLAISRWLWDAGIGRLADAVGAAAQLTLIPSGVLALLPLHAAWRPDRQSPDGRHHLIDLTTVRYTPNARILNSARARLAARAPGYRSVLAVLDPAASLLLPLPGATREVDRIATLIPTTRLAGQAATRGSVLGAWDSHDVLHFACHGKSIVDNPLDSAILLTGDRPLRVGDILDSSTSGNPLVVLSACETAVVGDDLPDEAVSLQSAFLYTGAHGVIGSLWAVDDKATARLMQRIYEKLASSELSPAEALRDAQRAARYGDDPTSADTLRDLGSSAGSPIEPNLTWMAFTYTGA
jgi:CHAT domain-containing protein